MNTTNRKCRNCFFGYPIDGGAACRTSGAGRRERIKQDRRRRGGKLQYHNEY